MDDVEQHEPLAGGPQGEAAPEGSSPEGSSPVGSSLLGREAGDAVEVERPGGRTEYEVVEVRRAPPA